MIYYGCFKSPFGCKRMLIPNPFLTFRIPIQERLKISYDNPQPCDMNTIHYLVYEREDHIPHYIGVGAKREIAYYDIIYKFMYLE